MVERLCTVQLQNCGGDGSLEYDGVSGFWCELGGNMLLPDSEGATPLDALGEAQQEGKKLYTDHLLGFGKLLSKSLVVSCRKAG